MSFSKLDRRWQELSILLALMVLTTPIFWLTDLDRKAAALFYQPGAVENHWPVQTWWLWDALYKYADIVAITLAVCALLMTISAYVLPSLTRFKRPALYIFLVIVLGPGLVVNAVFKDHWGRPRPVHTTDFGGEHAYIPPLKIGHTSDKSFPCGHCSVGYMLFALYFLSRRRKVFYFALTLVSALLLALARMSAGGHFVSDILWSGYLVFAVAWVVYYAWYQRGIDVH